MSFTCFLNDPRNSNYCHPFLGISFYLYSFPQNCDMPEQFCDRIWIQQKKISTRNGRSRKKEVKFCHIVLLQCRIYLSIKSALLYSIKRISKNHYFFLNYTYLRARSASFNLPAITIGDIFIRVLAIASTVRRWRFANLRRSYYRIDSPSQQIAERNVYSPIPLKLRHRINLAVKRRSWRPP